jgi:hypothetical protein
MLLTARTFATVAAMKCLQICTWTSRKKTELTFAKNALRNYGRKKKMKKIVDIDEKFLEAARAALAKKMPWEKNVTAKQTVNAALSFYAAYANKKG